MVKSMEWEVQGGLGTVEVTATGLYIEGEFLEDNPTEGKTND